MKSIFKVPEFITTMSGITIKTMLFLILSEKMGISFLTLLKSSWSIALFGLISFILMGVLMRFIMGVESNVIKISFGVAFIFVSVFWSLALFLLMIVKANNLGVLIN